MHIYEDKARCRNMYVLVGVSAALYLTLLPGYRCFRSEKKSAANKKVTTSIWDHKRVSYFQNFVRCDESVESSTCCTYLEISSSVSSYFVEVVNSNIRKFIQSLLRCKCNHAMARVWETDINKCSQWNYDVCADTTSHYLQLIFPFNCLRPDHR